MGLSRGLLRVTASVSAFEVVGEDERQHGLTSAVLHGGLDAGKIAGPVLGGLVAHVIGLAAMFQVILVVIMAVYLALLLGARRSGLRPPQSAGTAMKRRTSRQASAQASSWSDIARSKKLCGAPS